MLQEGAGLAEQSGEVALSAPHALYLRNLARDPASSAGSLACPVALS